MVTKNVFEVCSAENTHSHRYQQKEHYWIHRQSLTGQNRRHEVRLQAVLSSGGIRDEKHVSAIKIHVWLIMCGAVVMVAEVKLDGAGILSLSAGVSFTLHLFLGRVQLCFFVLSSARSHHPRLSFAVLMQIVSETLATLLFTQHSCLFSFTISCESPRVSYFGPHHNCSS